VFRVGVDVGGTFTDLVALSDEGLLINIKVSTTPKTPEVGVINAFKKFLADHSAEEVRIVTHATTIATNAIFGQLELELPKTALITTKGFRDVLEIGRQRRPELYNLFFQRPKPLIPRRYRYEIHERVGADGRELVPVSREDLERVVGEIRREGVRSVAVGLINSYANPKHEEEVKRFVENSCPGVFVVSSSEVSPEYREYERISTTAVNAVLMPIVSTYIQGLLTQLKTLGISAPLYVMQSNGGLARAWEAAQRPAAILESGPAAGVIASAFYSRILNEPYVMSFDMGGTTAKAGAVREGTPELVNEYEVGGRVHRGRIVKGSGYTVRLPFIDLAECSAGGGTIAWVDEAGALRVGPVSAGAHPGPACYGMGGTQPTITDANLVLGRLPPHLLGGEMRLHPNLAKEAIRSGVCEPLGLELEEAAMGIITIANSMMAKILRIVSIERGYDPRRFSLIAFGGAGPMHVCALADELGISQIIVPPNPGLFSALGLLVSDVTHTYVRALMRRVSEVDPSWVEAVFKGLERRGWGDLRRDGFRPEDVLFIRQLDARYLGQSYELTIPAPKPVDEKGLEELLARFHEKHRSVYGYSIVDGQVELVNARVTAVGVIPKPKIRRCPAKPSPPPMDSLTAVREVYFEEFGGYVKCPVYLRDRLRPGNHIDGPLIVEQYDSTTVVYPGWELRVDELGNLRLTRA